MDDFDNRFAPGYGTEFTCNSAQYDVPHTALQEVSWSGEPTRVAISPGPPIADYRQKKKRRPIEISDELEGEFDDGDDLAVMIVKGHA